MISIVCPNCGVAKCIIFEPCMDDLIRHGRGTTVCENCHKTIIVYNGANKIEVMIDDSNSSD